MKKWIPIIFVAVLVPILGYFFVRGTEAENRLTKNETRLNGQKEILVDIRDDVKWLTRNRPKKVR